VKYVIGWTPIGAAFLAAIAVVAATRKIDSESKA